MTYENLYLAAATRLTTALEELGADAPDWKVLRERDACIDEAVRQIDDPEWIASLIVSRPDMLDYRPNHAFTIKQILASQLARELERDLKPQMDEYLAEATRAPSP